MTYTIRFQNTGNAEAIDIAIRDTIDTDLDSSTIRVISSSFPIRTFVKGQALEFFFDNIWLSDSITNEPESHGFITYEIQPVADLDDFTEISNTAHIFFDFNPAIVTNATVSTMVGKIPVGLYDVQEAQIIIQPNPANDIIHLLTKNNELISKVLNYNYLGSLVLSQKEKNINIAH